MPWRNYDAYKFEEGGLMQKQHIFRTCSTILIMRYIDSKLRLLSVPKRAEKAWTILLLVSHRQAEARDILHSGAGRLKNPFVDGTVKKSRDWKPYLKRKVKVYDPSGKRDLKKVAGGEVSR